MFLSYKSDDRIDIETLLTGECEIPKWLKLFWQTTLGGMNKRNSDRIERLSDCYSQDSIFSITKGNIKPRKQILLGVELKSMTGSKKVINILNRQGYCIGYSNILELETSAAYSCSSSDRVCPSSIIKTSILSCGVAWDNFDRYVETDSGKDTLHDTVGIIYQDIPNTEELELIKSNSNSRDTCNNNFVSVRDSSGRRKRSFDAILLDDLSQARQHHPLLDHHFLLDAYFEDWVLFLKVLGS
ncbi:hypothetical protein TKK_0015494 [Trichogramma kaykai]